MDAHEYTNICMLTKNSVHIYCGMCTKTGARTLIALNRSPPKLKPKNLTGMQMRPDKTDKTHLDISNVDPNMER